MDRKRTKVSGSNKGRLHRLYFKGPKILDVEKLADRLLELELVEQVVIASHRDGYVARVRFWPGREPARGVHWYIASNISKDFGEVVEG